MKRWSFFTTLLLGNLLLFGIIFAVVRVAFPIPGTRVLSDVLYGFATMLLVAVALSVLLGWMWRRPLRQINRIARDISHGDLGDIPPVSGPLEMAELATSIDRMRKMVASQLATITQQQERFRIILHHLPNAVFALNHADEVLYCNESAGKLFRIDTIDRPQHLQQIIRHGNMLIARKGSIKTWAMAPAVKPLDQKQEEYHRQ